MNMRKKLRDPHLGPAEMEMLRHIIQSRETTLREASDYFAELRGYGRTTVQKTLERLRAKGFVDRKLTDGVYQYAATMTQEDLDAYVVEDFVQINLGGTISPLLSFLTQKEELSDDQRRRIEEIMRELDKG
jgi:predicted transcriptional regulator